MGTLDILGEDSGPKSVCSVIYPGHCFVLCVKTRHDNHWTEDYILVDRHIVGDVGRYSGGNLIALGLLHRTFAADRSRIFGLCAFYIVEYAGMRDPHQYTKALVVCQSMDTVIYTVIGNIVYYICGSYVASPALGSVGVTMKKVCYGLALSGLCIGTVLLCHLPAKYVFVRILRGSKHLTSNTKTHWITWLSCTTGITLISYIIASAIPVFGGLVSLVGALFATLLSFHPYACMWLYDNWHLGKSKPTKAWFLMVGWCGFIIASGTLLVVAGTYGSVVSIADSYQKSGGSAAWSCKDNSGSV